MCRDPVFTVSGVNGIGVNGDIIGPTKQIGRLFDHK